MQNENREGQGLLQALFCTVTAVCVLLLPGGCSDPGGEGDADAADDGASDADGDGDVDATADGDVPLDVETGDDVPADRDADFDVEVEPLPDCSLFVSPDGSDDNEGSEARPWATLAFAFGRLAAGDTLCVRGGIYREGDLELESEGTGDRPITIRSYPGENPVVLGSLAAFETPGNGAWEVVDAGIGLYRTVDAVPCSDGVHGKIEYEGGLYSLVVYHSYEGISTQVQTATADGVTYLGPGIYCDGAAERVYIRLEPPSEEAMHGRIFNVAENPDPGAHAIFIGTMDYGISFRGTAAFIRIDGLDLRHHRTTIRPFMNTHDIALTNLVLTAGFNGIVVGDDVDGEPVHNLLIESVVLNLHLPPWISWTDIKSLAQPADSLKLGGVVFAGGAHDVEIRGCLFEGVFDGITATATVPEPVHHVSMTHNVFSVFDDALQLCTSAYEIEFGYNTTQGPGPSHHGCGSSAFPGTKYIHHNVIAPTTELLWGRYDPDEVLDPRYRGWAYHTPFPTHDSDLAGDGDPWKIYHNTLLYYNWTTVGPGEQLFGPSASGALHEVLNNIFVQHADHMASRGARMHDGSTIYDGNLWHRPVAGPTTPLFRLWEGADGTHDFDTLADFLASPFFAVTQTYYAPGWESSGVEADPLLDAGYRPSASGPAAGGAVDLSDRGWPGVTGEVFRGALAPAGD